MDGDDYLVDIVKYHSQASLQASVDPGKQKIYTPLTIAPIARD